MALAVAAKKQARQPTESENGTSSTAHDSPKAHAKRVTTFLDILRSDSNREIGSFLVLFNNFNNKSLYIIEKILIQKKKEFCKR